MAYTEQLDYVENVKKKMPEYFRNQKVLEVGSLNINGSVRPFFQDCDYLGIDVGEGPDVDLVCSGHEFIAPEGTYDVVTSNECFEHNPFWVETLKNMIFLCKKGGLVIVTCTSDNFPEHGTRRTTQHDCPLTQNLTYQIDDLKFPWYSYYQNLNEKDFRRALNFDEHFSSYEFTDIIADSLKDWAPDIHSLGFWGIKR